MRVGWSSAPNRSWNRQRDSAEIAGLEGGGRQIRLPLRQFLELELNEQPPDHSTISRTRRLIDVETHQAVFGAFKEIAECRLIGVETFPRPANQSQPRLRWGSK